MLIADFEYLGLGQAAGKAVDPSTCATDAKSAAAASACIRALVMGGKSSAVSPPPPPRPAPASRPVPVPAPVTPKAVAEEVEKEEVEERVVGENILEANGVSIPTPPVQPVITQVVVKQKGDEEEGSFFSRYWPYMAGGTGILVLVGLIAWVTRK